MGSANISVLDVYSAILARFFPGSFQTSWFADTIVWGLRLHRILLAIVAGMGLAIAGAVMQGILKNPLASPFTLGISSAASFGAALAIVLGAGFVGGEWLIIGNAFVFTLLASMTVYGLAKYKGITPETMILAGIAIMYLFQAMTSFLQYVGHAEQVQEVVFWMMGSMGRSSWDKVWIVTAVIAICFPYLLLKSWDINAMGAGDETATSLGVNVEKTRVICMMAVSLITASVICFTGTIGFIGLVSPHITRMVIGGDHRFLLARLGPGGRTAFARGRYRSANHPGPCDPARRDHDRLPGSAVLRLSVHEAEEGVLVKSKAFTEEERPDRKPHNPRAANGRLARAHHSFLFISLWQVSAARAIW